MCKDIRDLSLRPAWVPSALMLAYRRTAIGRFAEIISAPSVAEVGRLPPNALPATGHSVVPKEATSGNCRLYPSVSNGSFHYGQRRSSQGFAPVWISRSTSSTASMTACGLSN